MYLLTASYVQVPYVHCLNGSNFTEHACDELCYEPLNSLAVSPQS